MTTGIYKIINLTNGMVYVGSAVNVEKRLLQHRKMLRGGYHHSKRLQSAWIKYGEESFKFQIIYVVSDPAILIVKEQEFIDSLKAFGAHGYNMRPTAKNQLGMRHTEETKRKMSIAKSGVRQSPESIKTRAAGIKKSWADGHRSAEQIRALGLNSRGRIVSDETRKKCSEAQKTRPPITDKTRRKLSEAGKGRVVSEETRKKLSESGKGRPMPPLSEDRKKRLSQIMKGKVWTPEQIAQRWKTRRMNNVHSITL